MLSNEAGVTSRVLAVTGHGMCEIHILTFLLPVAVRVLRQGYVLLLAAFWWGWGFGWGGYVCDSPSRG